MEPVTAEGRTLAVGSARARLILTVYKKSAPFTDRATFYYAIEADDEGYFTATCDLPYRADEVLMEACTASGLYGHLRTPPEATNAAVHATRSPNSDDQDLSYDAFRGNALREPIFLNRRRW